MKRHLGLGQQVKTSPHTLMLGTHVLTSFLNGALSVADTQTSWKRGPLPAMRHTSSVDSRKIERENQGNACPSDRIGPGLLRPDAHCLFGG
jgi:hypothetical protein